jgi:hypothetical protein
MLFSSVTAFVCRKAWHASGDTDFRDLSIISKPRPLARSCPRAFDSQGNISFLGYHFLSFLQVSLEYPTEGRRCCFLVSLLVCH